MAKQQVQPEQVNQPTVTATDGIQSPEQQPAELDRSTADMQMQGSMGTPVAPESTVTPSGPTKEEIAESRIDEVINPVYVVAGRRVDPNGKPVK